MKKFTIIDEVAQLDEKEWIKLKSLNIDLFKDKVTWLPREIPCSKNIEKEKIDD